MDAKEIVLDELLATTFLLPSKNDKGLKFKGWADIESVDLVDGLTDASLILSATKFQTSTSFETYFCKGPRLFSVKSNLLKKLRQFKDLFQKTRALVKQCGKILCILKILNVPITQLKARICRQDFLQGLE